MSATPKIYDNLMEIVQTAISQAERIPSTPEQEPLKQASIQSMKAVLSVIEQQQNFIYSNDYAYEALDDFIISLKESYKNGEQDILDPEQMRELLLNHVEEIEIEWGLEDE